MKTRQDLADYADRLLLGARRYASPSNALITFPGVVGGYGRRVDGLEGFARTFLLAGFRLVGERGADPLGLADWYAKGLTAGTDPESSEAWITLEEHSQAKVEAASIALILDMTRPWIWDRLDPAVQRNVITYFSSVVGDESYPRNNWVWFRLVVQTFLRSVGGPYSASDIAADLATHDSYQRAGGWFSDGPERSYDHYVGWAMHLYPTLWAQMQGAEDLAGDRPERDQILLDQYLRDSIHLIGGNGSPLIQGRSLIYRFAAAAPYWVGALAQVPSVAPGQLRNAGLSIIGHFDDNGVPGDSGFLTMGWHHEWRPMAQSYSGTGSPYWATKGLLGLALPADHPVWTDPLVDLPVVDADQLLTFSSPGWIVSSTQADGIVRVVNHGTDHATVGANVGDSPLYTRFGYSTHTAPLLSESAWLNPVDQSVVLVNKEGQATHRAGMRTIYLGVQDRVGIAASQHTARWLDADSRQDHYGSGYRGRLTVGGELTVVSLVRGPWEIRAALAENMSEDLILRIGGWAIAGEPVDSEQAAGLLRVQSDDLHSSIAALGGDSVTLGVAQGTDDSPLGSTSQVPWITFAEPSAKWVAAIIELSSTSSPSAPLNLANLIIEPCSGHTQFTVTWPDQSSTTHLVDLD